MPFTHVAAPFEGVVHGMHERPHEPGDVSGRHIPEQSCVPGGHEPPHDSRSSMQAPLQSFLATGHVAPHDVPSQVAAPPAGAVHGRQEVPQVAMALLLTQLSPQRCMFGGQLDVGPSSVGAASGVRGDGAAPQPSTNTKRRAARFI
jgi:hypothetical protein